MQVWPHRLPPLRPRGVCGDGGEGRSDVGADPGNVDIGDDISGEVDPLGVISREICAPCGRIISRRWIVHGESGIDVSSIYPHRRVLVHGIPSGRDPALQAVLDEWPLVDHPSEGIPRGNAYWQVDYGFHRASHSLSWS
jgi:hypothetical protein